MSVIKFINNNNIHVDLTRVACFQTVLDHETHILNLTEANLTNKPQWVKEYSAKVIIILTSCGPTSMASTDDSNLIN